MVAYLKILNNVAKDTLPSERKAYDALLKNLITKNEKENAIAKLEAVSVSIFLPACVFVCLPNMLCVPCPQEIQEA